MAAAAARRTCLAFFFSAICLFVLLNSIRRPSAFPLTAICCGQRGKCLRHAASGERIGSRSLALTLAPLGVHLDDLVDKGHVLVPPPLGLADQLGVSTLVCNSGGDKSFRLRHATLLKKRRWRPRIY